MMAGVDMLHVPYRGAAPALTDLISGQVQVMILPIISSIEHLKAGRLRALGVTTATRLEVVPDIPTVAEFLPGYEVSDWTGIGVPRGTPVEIVDRLSAEINAGLDNPKIKARLAELGSPVDADVARRIRQDDRGRDREMGQVVASRAGIKPRVERINRRTCPAPDASRVFARTAAPLCPRSSTSRRSPVKRCRSASARDGVAPT
jgi:hypothetical protein